MGKKATIALDIDGTISDDTKRIPMPVASYLSSLHNDGHTLIFLTGRPFMYAMTALGKLSFPYILGVQNGSDIIEMPKKKRVIHNYFSKNILTHLDELYENENEDYLIYAGFEKGDFCYYRKDKFSAKMLDYLELLKALTPAPWESVSSFDAIEQNSFPLIKCVGQEAHMKHIASKMQELFDLEIVTIADPIEKGLYLNLLTHPKANKKSALEQIIQSYEYQSPIIAAGDDYNDHAMLSFADISIVMETAPKGMHNVADILAKSSNDCGIIDALQEALKRF